MIYIIKEVNMSPKTLFDKDSIINVALGLAKANGLSSITTRNVANRLGSSVAPIYVNFKTIEELISAVVNRVFELSNDLIAKQTSSSSFVKIGRASLDFAKEYPVLFRELVMEPNPYIASYDSLENSLLDSMSEDETMNHLSINDRRRMLFKMRVFQIGLSAMIANGNIPSWLSEKESEDLLLEVGEEFTQISKIK